MPEMYTIPFLIPLINPSRVEPVSTRSVLLFSYMFSSSESEETSLGYKFLNRESFFHKSPFVSFVWAPPRRFPLLGGWVGFVSLAPYVDSERRGVGVVAFFLVLFLANLGGGVCVDVSCS